MAVATGPCTSLTQSTSESDSLSPSLSVPPVHIHNAAPCFGRHDPIEDGVSSDPTRFDLIEFACGDESTIGKLGPKVGVSVCRLTLKTCNLTSKLGYRKALSIVRGNHGASMHSSTPCTPWSTWKHMNSHKLGHAFNFYTYCKTG